MNALYGFHSPLGIDFQILVEVITSKNLSVVKSKSYAFFEKYIRKASIYDQMATF